MLLSSLVHAPPLSFLSGSSPRLFSTRAAMSAATTSARIAVFGDVHDQWNLEDDTKALQFLQLDSVLFTGDFGEENVELVQSVANLKFAKAVILGNHDAWHTKKFSGKYGDGSAKGICKAALSVPEDHMVIILAHNGPTGLGSNSDDICGKDWEIGGGVYGDADLAQALSLLKKSGEGSVSLVVFGYMHKQLAGGKGLRKMIVVGADNTIYLNAAIVPRVERVKDEQGTSSKSVAHNETSVSTPESCGTIRAFTLVEILDGRVDKIVETWVSVVGDRTKLEEGHILF